MKKKYFIAKDESGSIWVYKDKPVKSEGYWVTRKGYGGLANVTVFVNELIKDYYKVSWEDSCRKIKISLE